MLFNRRPSTQTESNTSMARPTHFSFAEVVQGRDANVRVTDDGLLYAVDLAMVVTGKNRDDSGKALRNISDEIFLSGKFAARRISRHGGYKTKLVSFEHAIELIMVLPGQMAKRVRKQFKDIIVRYLDGDTSMCSEIEANKVMGKSKSYSQFANNIMHVISDENLKLAYEMPRTCYVYATKSTAFPGLVKIGKSMDVSKRLIGLNTSCKPAPHVIVAVAPTFDQDRDEKTAHSFFSSARREGEFFELEDAEVLVYFTTHITTQYNSELAQNIAKLRGMSL